MPKIAPTSVLLAMLALSPLAACAPDADPGAMQPSDQPREFSEEDKIAARALSISDNRAVNAASPYAQSLLCRHAMGVLEERFAQAGAATEQVMQGISQAKAYFNNQLRVHARAEGKSADEIDRDLEQTAQENESATANARIAVGCLRKLQETA